MEITHDFGVLLSAASGNDKQDGDEQENVVILALVEFMPSTEFHKRKVQILLRLF